ncbi:PQQ-dependent sugar dehydrogenase [Alkalisalibacterium limincola]|uniref:PQQ-dependent sugar dehydrogenase n=1 Tax=Alkalisalibacterium limincola TaxID=2699169 RepID=A0A5C8KQL5_9GAMM|nr:PQQ-dependent sugar dehydrogenase [Alkalisalibacterium limincola]TXK62051.1 PQQ-dependent sugar dehydrogenase [Alkalisalibacterium limincola]
MRTNSLPALTATTAAVTALLVAGAAVASPSVSSETVASDIASEAGALRLTRVVSGLEHPWAVAWLPDGRMLVTERPGRMHIVDGDDIQSLSGVPDVGIAGGNQGGLLDVVVHPDHARNGWVYFTYSSPGDNDAVTSGEDIGTATALARARINDDGDGLTDVETLYAQMPRHNPGRHYGSRIVFPGDGHVVFSIGDRGLRWTAQDLTDPAGSIIRLREDGGAPDSNPFVGKSPGNLRPEIWSFGHRNNQGLAIHPDTGEIWTTEHGPKGGDVLHRIEEGANYGWPQVAHGTEYSTDEQVGIGREAPGVTPAVYVWDESMAPSGLAFYTGDAFPAWQGQLFAGSLAKKQLHRLVIDGQDVTHEEVLLSDTIGRIRDVRQGPDGYLYLLTDEEDGGLYRLEPAG